MEREDSLWTQELHFIFSIKVDRLQKSRKGFEDRRIHQLLSLQTALLMTDEAFGHVCLSQFTSRQEYERSRL